MSVPFLPRAADAADRRSCASCFGDAFFYIVYFQEPGVADAELGGTRPRPCAACWRGDHGRRAPPLDPSDMLANDGRGFVDRLPEPDGLPDWLSQAELDHYVAEFTRTGFTGGVNWYRNLDRNWELTEHAGGAQVHRAVAVHRRQRSTRCS